MQIIIFIFITALFSNPALAQIRSSVEAGLGITNNANFEQDDRNSDIYYKVQAQASAQISENLFGIRLNYSDFLREDTNDSFSYRISDKWTPASLSWIVSGALLGRHYTNGSAPGFKDTAFNHVGWDLRAARPSAINAHTLLEFGPGVRARYYTGAGSRTDHQLYGFVDLSYDQTSQLSFNADFEVGYLQSSDPEYKQFSYDLNGSVDYEVHPDLSWNNSVSVGKTRFSKRTIDVVTVVTRRRGVTQATTSAENESYTFVGFTSEITKSFTTSFNGKARVSHSIQSSKSGYQDYSATELFMSLIWRL